MNALFRLWHTSKHLKPRQLYGRLWFAAYRPRPQRAPTPPLRLPCGPLVDMPRRPQSLVGPAQVILLNEAHDITDATAWQDASRDALWRYHLHYFDDLDAVGASERAAWHEALIARWITENPPVKGIGWDPYPLSRRIVNWIKWHLRGHRLSARAVHALAIQLRYLRARLEWHLMGNHLLANAKALVFGGLFFCGPEADRWAAFGSRLLAGEVPRQILADGGHLERSPLYHSLVFEDLLDLRNLSQHMGVAPPPWHEVPARMAAWLAALCHPDGELALFGDTALGIAPPPAALLAYATRLGDPLPHLAPGLRLMAESGYARLARDALLLLCNVGSVGADHLPGHNHADTLSFELSLCGQRVFVDSGTSTYAVGRERSRQRGSAAHNTLVVDGQDSSEMWRAFRVARRARVVERHTTEDRSHVTLTAAHDGYRRLPGVGCHRRTWRVTDGQLDILDELQGTGTHTVTLYFHLHPAISLRQCAQAFDLLFPNGTRCAQLRPDPKLTVRVEQGSYHPEFNQAIAAPVLSAHWHGPLPVTFATTITIG